MSAIGLKKRVLPTKIARMMVQRVYGRPVSDEAWRNWKEWAGCPGRKIWMDLDDLAKVLAIAAIRSTNRFGELDRQTINSMVPSASAKLHRMIKEMDEGLILGKDIPAFIESYCFKRPSSTSLYRKIPGFSRKNIYEKRLVIDSIAA